MPLPASVPGGVLSHLTHGNQHRQSNAMTTSTDSCTPETNWRLPERREVEGLGAKGEGLEKYGLAENCHGDRKVIIANIVCNRLITTYEVRWVLEIWEVTL